MDEHSSSTSTLHAGIFAAIIAWISLLIASGYLYHRQPWQSRSPMANAISDKIYRFCTSATSVSSEIAKDVSQEPTHVAKILDGGQHVSITEHSPSHSRKPPSQADMQRARKYGNWGDSEPSELFL
jgi:hypothetical protein